MRVCPTGSKARACGDFDSGINRAARATAARPIGKLIQKIELQPIVCVKAPPMSGPNANESPAIAPQTPIAFALAFVQGRHSR